VNRQRVRAQRSMFGGAAVAATGFFAGIAVAPLAAQDLTGGVALSGLPGAMGIIGTALGASLVSLVLRRRGRRAGLTVGYVIGLLGAAIAGGSLRLGSFPLLLVGSALFGIGHAATQLTRYVVADLHQPDERGRALGWIVWAGTIGGVVGPNLLAVTGRAAEAAGQPELSGPYMVGVAAMLLVAVAYQVALRPDPGTLVVDEAPDVEPDVGAEVQPDVGAVAQEPVVRSAWRLPVVQVAIAVMLTGQVVMVWLMAMTPVHIRESGGDLSRIGMILSAHIFGMYALAPLAGWVEDRFGSLRAIGVAMSVLALAAVLAASAPVGGVAMAAALFLLGVGWSFGFVAGSTMLARGVPIGIRAAVQGRVETAVWLASAVASLGAGLLLDLVGYVGLCSLALVALALPITFVIRQRHRLAAVPAPVPAI